MVLISRGRTWIVKSISREWIGSDHIRIWKRIKVWIRVVAIYERKFENLQMENCSIMSSVLFSILVLAKRVPTGRRASVAVAHVVIKLVCWTWFMKDKTLCPGFFALFKTHTHTQPHWNTYIEKYLYMYI